MNLKTSTDQLPDSSMFPWQPAGGQIDFPELHSPLDGSSSAGPAGLGVVTSCVPAGNQLRHLGCISSLVPPLLIRGDWVLKGIVVGGVCHSRLTAGKLKP